MEKGPIAGMPFGSIIALVMVLWTCSAGAAEPEQLYVGAFSAGKLDGWEPKAFAGETVYRLTPVDGTTALRADSRAAASGLVKKIRIDLETHPYLNWTWRIENRPAVSDERQKPGDDFAARIYVVVSGGLRFWNTRALNYVWANQARVGEFWENPFAKKNAIMLALRSSGDKTSTWYVEKRNVREDLSRVFGEDIRHIDAVALMTDTDNSRSSATSFYGDIYFSSR